MSRFKDRTTAPPALPPIEPPPRDDGERGGKIIDITEIVRDAEGRVEMFGVPRSDQ